MMDDKTGEKQAVVHLSVSHHELTGEITQWFGTQASPRCTACTQALKDKPLEGLRILWGLKQIAQGGWTAGHLLDVKTGNIYKVKLKQLGEKLYVRKYVGISFLGHTQVWVR